MPNTWSQHNKLKPCFRHSEKFMVLFKSSFKIVHTANMGPLIIPLHHVRVVDPCNYNACESCCAEAKDEDRKQNEENTQV